MHQGHAYAIICFNAIIDVGRAPSVESLERTCTMHTPMLSSVSMPPILTSFFDVMPYQPQDRQHQQCLLPYCALERLERVIL